MYWWGRLRGTQIGPLRDLNFSSTAAQDTAKRDIPQENIKLKSTRPRPDG